jgi:hypothetical protein
MYILKNSRTVVGDEKKCFVMRFLRMGSLFLSDVRGISKRYMQ